QGAGGGQGLDLGDHGGRRRMPCAAVGSGAPWFFRGALALAFGPDPDRRPRGAPPFPHAMADLVRPVDLAELRAFCAAVDLGSLGAAARALQVSQPALSKRMRELEALAGTKLVDRHPRGIAPTQAGERLYLQARKPLAQAEEVEAL